MLLLVECALEIISVLGSTCAKWVVLVEKEEACLRRAFCVSDIALVLAGFGINTMIWTAKAKIALKNVLACCTIFTCV